MLRIPLWLSHQWQPLHPVQRQQPSSSDPAVRLSIQKDTQTHVSIPLMRKFAITATGCTLSSLGLRGNNFQLRVSDQASGGTLSEVCMQDKDTCCSWLLT